MEAPEVIDIVREAIWVLVITGAPVMLTALIVGLIVSLFQALTQIQEQTLTFVPKLLAMLFVLTLAFPYMIQSLVDFSDNLFAKIADMD
jgi:flagellar biosynthesis protein FliQ